jgi:hypothetical protein
MSYLHCPTCKCAYNIAQSALCPNCPVPMSEVDPTEDIVAAAEQLARALARATPAQRQAAAVRMDQLAIQTVTPPPPPKPQPLLAAIAFAVVERISGRISELSDRAPQLMERVPSRLRRAGSLVRARVRALAA